MEAANKDAEPVRLNLVDQAMLGSDPSGPAPREIVFQGLRLAEAGKGLPMRLADEADDSKGLRPILFDPPGKILERRRVKFQASQRLPRSRVRPGAVSPPGGAAVSASTTKSYP
jgi:hypothetical protein